MVNRFDIASRAQARLAMKNLLAACEGPRLRGRSAASVRATDGDDPAGALRRAGGVRPFGSRGVGATASLRVRFILELLAPRITQSLEEKFGHQFSFALGPTSLERGENGVTLAFQGIAIKDRSGRTLVAAPRGEIWLDMLALAGLDVKAKRLELVGLDLHLTVQPDGALSVQGAKAPGRHRHQSAGAAKGARRADVPRDRGAAVAGRAGGAGGMGPH